MFKRVLIANRGEIAVRIVRACRELGLETVSIYSEADRSAPHVLMADRAEAVGPAEASLSYLDADAILAAATRSGADAIHPGYGFLAENAEFARAVADAGLTWIGPPASAMDDMGSKMAARAAMERAGVPIVPGYQGSQEAAALTEAARRIGYPLLVKASAGGGGKGMRLVEREAELADALESARREARAAFDDERVFLEKAIQSPRHIEFQILADDHGNTLHLFERECSIQRRHQKIVEESPSPLLSSQMRERMGQAAVRAAREVGYVNAGTVEFLVGGDGAFYFLEMNTRLQVEHPVTELTTGIDLVHWQLRIAAGEPLPWRQSDLRQRGHAIESRLYAEDPAEGFLPATGLVQRWQPPEGPGVRVDSGVAEGDEVSRFYDPMLAKIITWGEERGQALDRMERALSELVVLGEVRTNREFLLDVMAHPVFRAGEATIDFIERHMTEWQPAGGVPPQEAVLAAALGALLAQDAAPSGQIVDDGEPYTPWLQLNDFRIV